MIVNSSNSSSKINDMFANRVSEIEKNKKEEAEEKLASGKRINDASDDAAGLAITEDLLAVMKGWNAAAQNTTSGISFTQVADGALGEVESILQRVNELAVQSSNGIYNDSDRSAIDTEMNALMEEIDRIAGTTEFNGIPVLQTSEQSQEVVESINELIENTPSSIMAYSGQDTVTLLEDVATMSENVVEMVPSGEGLAVSGEEGSFTYEDDVLTITASGDFNVVGTGGELTEQITVADDVGDVNITLSNVNTDVNNLENEPAINQGTNNNVTITLVENTNQSRSEEDAVSAISQGENEERAVSTMSRGGNEERAVSAISQGGNEEDTVSTISQGTDEIASGTSQDTNGITDFHVGNESDDYVSFTVQNMDSESLGLGNVSLATAESSLTAIDTVQGAMDLVTSYRSEIGATQNGLEATYSNLMSMVENATNTMSRIGDADMSREIINAANSNLTKEVAQKMMKEEQVQNENAIKLIEEGGVTF